MSRALLCTVARIVLVGLTSAACRATEPGVALERDAALVHVTSDATPETDAPAAAVIVDASATAPAKCRTAVELQREFIDEEPHPLVPGLDLDGDGKNDPVFVVAQGGPRVLLLYVEKAGCARQIGTVRASDPKTVRILGRDKAGWAIVHGATPFTFDEIEEKLIYEGTRYVVWTRQRDYPLPAPGKKRTVSAWSAWTRDEQEDSGTDGSAK